MGEVNRQQRRAIKREFDKVVERAIPDPALREEILALYRSNPLLKALYDSLEDEDGPNDPTHGGDRGPDYGP